MVQIYKEILIMLSEINGANLAYVGDAVLELMVRKKLVLDGGKIGELNKQADSYVCAGNQSRVADRILPVLTEEELSVYKRGKNIHTNSIPKSATHIEYRKATGLEALFGYLYLAGETKRLEELFNYGFFEKK